jgi:hypothetical protein
VESLSKLPLDAVAAGLRQFDVTLDGIDVVGVGERRASKPTTRMRRRTPARWEITRQLDSAGHGW